MPVSFSEQVVQLTPRLRSFARSLSRDYSTADDLVQETVLRALTHADQFTPGTNLVGWLNTILRNSYFNERRKARHFVSLEICEALSAPSIDSPQESKLHFSDVDARFSNLPAPQLQALTLIAADGHSYAAKVVACAVGTMKSRVSVPARHWWNSWRNRRLSARYQTDPTTIISIRLLSDHRRWQLCPKSV
jgi:RNA polymerase sigma-70 factor, ECF subfamily